MLHIVALKIFFILLNKIKYSKFHFRSHREGKMILHYGDLIDGNCLVKIINDTKPTEIYNLGAQSHVKVGINALY